MLPSGVGDERERLAPVTVPISSQPSVSWLVTSISQVVNHHKSKHMTAEALAQARTRVARRAQREPPLHRPTTKGITNRINR